MRASGRQQDWDLIFLMFTSMGQNRGRNCSCMLRTARISGSQGCRPGAAPMP